MIGDARGPTSGSRYTTPIHAIGRSLMAAPTATPGTNDRMPHAMLAKVTPREKRDGGCLDHAERKASQAAPWAHAAARLRRPDHAITTIGACAACAKSVRQ